MLPLLEDCPNDSDTIPVPWSLVDGTIIQGDATSVPQAKLHFTFVWSIFHTYALFLHCRLATISFAIYMYQPLMLLV